MTNITFDHFKTLTYEGAWIPFDGDRMHFRLLVEQCLQEALVDSAGKLLVDERGPHWMGEEKLAGLSYSNSAEWGVLVFSRTHELGVDLERQDRTLKKNYLALAKRFFHLSEYEALKLGSVFDGQSRFLKLWMEKEAYSKLRRENLAQHINQVVSDQAEFEPVMKTRIGYWAVVAIGASC